MNDPPCCTLLRPFAPTINRVEKNHHPKQLMNAHHDQHSATGSYYTYMVGYSLYGTIYIIYGTFFWGGVLGAATTNTTQPNSIPTSIGFRTSSFSLKLKDPAVHPKTVVSTLLRVAKSRGRFRGRGSKSWRMEWMEDGPMDRLKFMR